MLRNEWIKNSPVKKDPGIVVNKKLDVSRQYVLTGQKVNRILSYNKSSVISRVR